MERSTRARLSWGGQLLLALLVTVGAGNLAWSIVRSAIGESLLQYLDRAPGLSPDGQREALDWAVTLHPSDPVLRLRRGSLELALATEEGKPADALRSLEDVARAAQLGPADYRHWLALGRALDRVGARGLDLSPALRSDLPLDETASRAAFERALALAPHYFETHWALGNHLLRSGGDRQAAFEQLRTALAIRPSAFPLIFDYAWTAYRGDAVAIADALAPSPELLAQMATLLVRRHQPEAGLALWARHPTPGLVEGREFANSLIALGRYRDADRIWQALDLPDRSLPDGDSLLSNGGFEKRIALQSTIPFLEWRIHSGGGIRVALDRKEPQAGQQSLRVSFNLESNQPVTIASQTVPALPNRTYCLRFFVRTEGLMSLSLPRLELLDPAVEGRVGIIASPPFPTEQADWSEQLLRLSTGPKTEALLVRLQRPPCADPLCALEGRIWLDSLQLNLCGGPPATVVRAGPAVDGSGTAR
jgi:tetratricopeptide (TPR) repeat protein